MKPSVLAFTMLFLVACGERSEQPTAAPGAAGADANGHVEATRFTSEANAAVGSTLSLEDQADFDAVNKGFVAKDDPLVVKTKEGRVIWNAPAYAFVDGAAPASVNPSLWRQAKLNDVYGLFKVTDGIHQVRGYDISNMSIIETANGRILVDPLTSTETAAAALALVNRALGERPIVAVIFTHSHVDHFGGAASVVDADSVRSGKTQIVAPTGFMKEALSENVLAGRGDGAARAIHVRQQPVARRARPRRHRPRQGAGGRWSVDHRADRLDRSHGPGARHRRCAFRLSVRAGVGSTGGADVLPA